MEMNQTLQAVSVVLKDVLLLVRIATNLLVFVELYHIAVKKMDLLPTMLPVSVDHLNVLLIPVSIVLNLLVRVLLDHLVLKPMELLLILLHVVVVQQNVLRILVYSVTNQTMVQEVVIKLLIQLHIQKLKVVHVVRYLEELVLRIKQRARLRQVILV